MKNEVSTRLIRLNQLRTDVVATATICIGVRATMHGRSKLSAQIYLYL